MEYAFKNYLLVDVYGSKSRSGIHYSLQWRSLAQKQKTKSGIFEFQSSEREDLKYDLWDVSWSWICNWQLAIGNWQEAISNKQESKTAIKHSNKNSNKDPWLQSALKTNYEQRTNKSLRKYLLSITIDFSQLFAS